MNENDQNISLEYQKALKDLLIDIFQGDQPPFSKSERCHNTYIEIMQRALTDTQEYRYATLKAHKDARNYVELSRRTGTGGYTA